MKQHIVRVVAVVTAVLMLLSIVPAAALQELSLPNLMSVVTDVTEDTSATEEAKTETPSTETTTKEEETLDTSADDEIVNDENVDDEAVEEPAGEDSVTNEYADGDTVTDENGVTGNVVVDDEDFDFADDVVLGKEYSFVGPVLNTSGTKAAETDKEANGMVNKKLSPYEPYKTQHEDHPFLPYGSAWIDLSNLYYGAPATQNFPVTDWSANTSVYNITGTGKYYEGGMCDGEEIYLFPDLNLIDGYTFAGYSSDERLEYAQRDENGNIVLDKNNKIVYTGIHEHGAVSSKDTIYTGINYVEQKNGKEAFAYNRYDAMNGKYGITIDRNAKMVRWQPAYVADYYPNGDDYYGSVGYISDTPYLYFSTEAPESTQMAISLLIGTPVQKEVGGNGTTKSNGKVVENEKGTVTTNTGYFEYRWYTITDNAARPGVSTDSRDLSMTPNVTVSDPVGVFMGQSNQLWAYQQQNSTVIPALNESNKLDPLALAAEKGIDIDTLYTDGSITGCYDFSNILPTIYGHHYVSDAGYSSDRGREDAQFKISQIRVDVRTKEGYDDSASRINYLYFGPSLVTTFLPQTTDGASGNASNWQYAQSNTNNTIDVNGAAGTSKLAGTETTTERAYTSGWENGAAVSIVNTPENPQLYTIDIHGKGDGKLIPWSEVPASATVRQDNYTAKDNSMVWKFTDNNNVVQYMEAQILSDPNGSIDQQVEDNYVVMVTVPIRKWVNVLGESRKISMTTTLLHSGKDASGNTLEALRPSFTFWGNNDGALGYGHGALGTRFRHEDILMVFGQKYQAYHTDSSGDYVCAEVDRTIGDSTIYNEPGGTKESWYDTLRSPYFYDQTVKTADQYKKLTEDHAGYAFITTLRFAMPIDSAISIQNMKGDGNSAGLNTYSATGEIVSAYDGGTGAQPEINITNTMTEKSVTIKAKSSGTTDSPDDFTYTQNNYGDGKISGTITAGSAAYGPMLQESYYTIYDILDTEMLRATSKESHNNKYLGKNQQPVYGHVWKAREDLVIRHIPDDSGAKYGYVYGGSQFVIYSTVKISDKSNTKWGLTGVLTKNGSTEVGWVKMWDGVANKTYVDKISGVQATGYSDLSLPSSTDWGKHVRNVMKELRNDWVLSNFNTIDNGADFRDGTNTNFEYTEAFRTGSNNAALGSNVAYNPAQNVVTQCYSGGSQLKYANMWTGGQGHYSCGYAMQDFHLRAINGTDMEWGFTRKVQPSGTNASLSLTRAFDNPIRLKQGKTYVHASYPVLYLDYTSNKNFKIGLSLRVDGVDKLWYLSTSKISHDSADLTSGNKFAYLSFEDIMTKDYKNASTIEVTGISMYMWHGGSETSSNVVIRRCEIWQEETDWLDTIIAANQQEGGNSSTAMNEKVHDSMNVINDAFFNYHSETADGEITVTKGDLYASNADSIGVNNADRAYKYTYADGTKTKAMDYWENSVHYKYNRTESYRKNNSNKGWRAYLRLDTTDDGVVDEKDTTYYSDGTTAVDEVFEYSTAVGNLRVWVPSATQASLVFESDRSFNTKNYKYLYYSYSMRDVENGISAEEPDDEREDGLKPGITLAIKENQLGSGKAYSEVVTSDGERTLAYYDANNAYWAEDGRDNRLYKPTINASIDLSTLDGISSVNQFVIYLNNPLGTRGDGDKAEFYINYIKLSNVPPTDLIAERLEEEGTQYYYMMDNTGSRYSARFPTIDNPTGQVSGTNSDNDRVNPIIIERGKRLSDGVYFNGDRIYGYGTNTDGKVLDQTTASKGYYEKTYGQTDGYTGSMKNIMFYTGVSADEDSLDDITDYYDFKGENGAVGDQYDMKWSYGRWDLGSGLSGLNTMYIDPATDGIAGNLTRRYATENYVLLRAGIMPKKYITYFDAKGGQIEYQTSSDDIKKGVVQNLNNYYIDENVVFEYFKTPRIDTSLDGVNEPVKYGYEFGGWYMDNYAENLNPTDASRLLKYTKKEAAGHNYFFAKWTPNLPADTEHTVTFKHPQTGDTWYTRPANYETEFQMDLPTTVRVTAEGKQKHVIGWQLEGDTSGHIYVPGASVTIMEDVTFVPVLNDVFVNGDDAYSYTHTVTVNSAVTLKLFRNQTDSNGKPIYGDPSTLQIQSNTADGFTTYYNIPHGVVMVAVPNSPTSGWGWQVVLNADQTAKGDAAQTGGTVDEKTQSPVCSVNKDFYKFSVLSDMTFNYVNLSKIYDYDTGSKVAASSAAVVFTKSAETTVNTDNMYGREMKFYTQFDLSHISGVDMSTVVYGTLYTKSGSNFNAIAADLNNMMQIDTSSLNATSIRKGSFVTKTSAVRHIKATDGAANDSNQYYLMVTENKGAAVTYYARGYVIYSTDGGKTYQVAYSDTIARSHVPASTLSVDEI